MIESTLELGGREAPERNALGLSPADYAGGASTLCVGCGHDAVSRQIARAYFEMGIPPEGMAKFSGIGCSSKTPAYFISRAHGFNTVHGRMPSVATGALLANRSLKCLGVSGDGDSASIGLGQFLHAIRRNLPFLYVVENNGVYGLTKGQFSATADEGSSLKGGAVNRLPALDLCSLAVELGCGFVARGFSGDPKQLLAILKAAIAYRGLALVDVISPCVTFNNHEGSTKAYRYASEHDELLHQIGFVPAFEEARVEYGPGELREVDLPDGSRILLRKLEEDYDPGDDAAALERLRRARHEGQILTGIVQLRPRQEHFLELLGLSEEPIASLPEESLRPPREALEALMAELA